MLPILYQGPDLVIYSYPLLMGVGWGVAYQIFFSLIDKSYPHLRAQLLFWGVFLFAWLGAKSLFLLTSPEVPQQLLSEMSFWLGGGFVFYGGLIASILFLVLLKAWDKRVSINLLWPMLPALTFGHGIGRIGCFLAGCCYGAPTEFFWGINLHGEHRHPTQLIEAFGLIFLGIYLLRSKRKRVLGLIHYLLFYGVLRSCVELLRGDTQRGQWGALTPSQWISLGLVVSGVALFIFTIRKSEKPL
jgi:phosphatidylglycerol:prolipoprotein diacylglycerol transferase